MRVILNNVTKTYGDLVALNAASLEFEEGKFYGLLGPNGAGKTTLFNLLIQATEKSSGTITWEVEGAHVAAEDVYAHVGVVFQTHRLDKRLTVEENLITRGALYGLSKTAVIEKMIEFDNYLHIEALRKQKYGSLSGGQKRKVDIARALLHEPSLLLLDEPTTGLDPKSRHDLWQTIYELNKKTGMTVILITHYLEEMAFCDTLNVLIDGTIHYTGDINTFIKQNSQTNLMLHLKRASDVDRLNDVLKEKRTKIDATKVLYRGLEIAEIMDIITTHHQLDMIEHFAVQEATLEVAYLNLLQSKQGASDI